MLLTCDCGAGPIGGGAATVCTNTYAGGTVLGAATGSGAAATLGPCSLGHSGTMRTRHSTGGTLKDFVAAPVNMTFLGSYFSQKSFAYAEEEDEREVNDCLLIYDDEGEDAAPCSLSSCSFIADDLDDSFLDSLGPKFKKLAEICLGIDDEAKQARPGPKDRASGADVCARSTEVPQSGSQRYQTLPGSQVSSVLSPSGSVLPAIAIPDPLQLGNYLLTETHATSGSFVQPTAATFDPHLTQNVTVTERVICPLPSVSGSLVAPTELRGSYSMLYTKETCSHL
uniref:Cadherin Y-type LIR-motif domain-containing protein n=1 Tax=Peromyscus maniculatus bairdii TaxID=230844 RepID=A0A8C8W789_PERMB